MDNYILTDASGLFYVRNRDFNLGPFPSKAVSEEIKEALDDAYNVGCESVRRAMREVLGVGVVHVGN